MDKILLAIIISPILIAFKRSIYSFLASLLNGAIERFGFIIFPVLYILIGLVLYSIIKSLVV